MTTAHVHSEKRFFQQQISKLWNPFIERFDRLILSHVKLHALFFCIALVEIVLFVAFFTVLSQSTVLAFTLAVFFLTIFSYFILKLYIAAKKPDEMVAICETYFNACKEILRYQEGIVEHHIHLANAAQKFAKELQEKEYSYYASLPFLKSLAAVMEKISCFLHWQDVHRMKEILLQFSVEEHLKVVKCEPTNLEIHAALANAYVTLSSLYADPRKYPGYDENKWIPGERLSEEMQHKFRKLAEKAIEEFKILNDYAPEDPWVHVQLAYSYHDLQMPKEEIEEYETVLRLKPDDKETLFKLGLLYFQQGQNAKGLKAYELLRTTHSKKAESLIQFYGMVELP